MEKENHDELQLHLLNDSPVLRDDPNYYEFYHDYIAPALADLISENSTIHTIGLFGPWGTGKSTIIDNLKKDHLENEIFIFDSWKYKSDPLRRTFLLKLFEFVNENELWEKNRKLPENFLDNLYDSVSEEQEIKITNKKPDIEKKPWWRDNPISLVISYPYQATFVGLFLFLATWVASQYFLGEDFFIINIGLKFVGILGLSSTATAVYSLLGTELVKHVVKKVLDSLDSEVKAKKIITTREYLNSPEQFEVKFLEIAKRLSKKIVIVFDNIDRVQGDVAIEMLSSIKTFLEPINSDKVVFIIPCDSNAIQEQIKRYYGNQNIYSSDSSEYLRKIFNVIVWNPEFIGVDLEDFTKKMIHGLGGDAAKLKDEKLYLVINQAFKSNPREIKQFLNNLVASLKVAYNTEVRNIIFDNIPYFAKVLVIRQKFPKAYRKLKDHWFDPENILEDNNEALKAFMIDTSIVTTSNAEPFLYYKKPNQFKNLSRADEFSTSLISSNYEKAKEIAKENINKHDDVLSFILDLYKKYKTNPEWISYIIETFLPIASELEIKIDNTTFLNHTADVINRYTWNRYKSLPTNLIFEYIIKNDKTEQKFQNELLDRYTTVLSSEDLRQDINKVLEILENLIHAPNINNAQVQQIRQSINEHYSLDPKILELFQKEEHQNLFVSSKAFTSYISGINQDNFHLWLPVVYSYKTYAVNNQLTNNIIQKLNELLKQERSKSPTLNEDKELLASEITRLIFKPDELLASTDQNLTSAFGTEILTMYQQLGNLDAKYFMIPILYKLETVLDQTHSTQARNFIDQFITSASINTINESLLSQLENLKIAGDFINSHASVFIGRSATNGGQEMRPAYTYLSVENQQLLINGLIEHRPDSGLSFIDSLTQLPQRVTTIKKLLDKASKLQPQDRKGIYDWINKQVKRNDDISIKEEVVSQVKNLLKQDQSVYQETGYHLLKDSSYINETHRREIGDETIDWFRTPGKTINQNHRFSLLSTALLFNELNLTRRNDYVFELFKMLDRQNDNLSIEVAIESILTIKPKFKDFKENFIDLKEKMSSWTNHENRDYIIEKLLILKPNSATKEEENYWRELSALKTHV